MKTIQAKFVIIILSGVLLSAILIGSVAVFSFQEVTGKDSKKIMNLTCEKNASELNGVLKGIEQSVKIMEVYARTIFDEKKLEDNNDYREKRTAELESLAKNIADNTDGAVAVYFRFAPEIAGDTSGFFWSKSKDSDTFHSVPPTDISKYDPEDIEHVGWYYIPAKNGKPTWLLPYFNKNTNIYMISYEIPIYKDDTLIGIVGMDIDFKMVTEKVSQIKVYDTGYAFLTDAEGNIVYHNKLEMNTESTDGNKEITQIVHKLSQEDDEEALIDYDYNGTSMKMSYITLANDMRLVLTAPVSEIDKEKREMIWKFITLAALISIFFIFIMIKNTNSVVSFAYYDVLTGARNKNAYQEEVNRIEEQIHFGETQFAVVVFDVNNLKKTNDTYGHTVGDELIIRGYNQIRHVFKKIPVYRIGGDEFVVILENYSEEECDQYIRHFRDENRKKNSNLYKDEHPVYVASGCAMYDSRTDMTFTEVFDKADQAMYANKMDMKREQEAQHG